MGARGGRWWAALGLLLVLLAPGRAPAGPYLGDWGWCWHPSGNCTPWEYCWLHYWARDLYILRAWFHPSNLDTYAPGVPVPISYEYFPYHCRSTAPAPTLPYADPEGYYGRPLVPPPTSPDTMKSQDSLQVK